jgi:cardiolipin synthase A/B
VKSTQFSLLILLAVASFSCTSADRAPSSVTFDSDRANRIQEIDLQLSRYWNNDWKTDQKVFQLNPQSNLVKPVYDRTLINNPETRAEVNRLTEERQLLINELSAKLQLQNWSGIGSWFESTFLPVRSAKEEKLQIKNPEDYALSGSLRNPFPLEHRFYASYKLKLENLLPYPGKSMSDEPDNNQYYLKARMECNGDIIYDNGFLFFHNKKRTPVYEFNWYYNKKSSQNVSVEFAPNVSRCRLLFYDPQVSKTWTHGIEFADLLTLNPDWYKLSNQIDICARPMGAMGDPVASFFWQQDFNFNTCTETYDELISLDDTYNSVNQRVLALTGSPLRRKDFDDKNPMAPLDFSKAPKFDIIWVSSLIYSADFYGSVLSRALRYHAERGTQIRILTSEVMMKRKDKALVEELQRGVPNVKVQYYQYHLSDGTSGSWLDHFHRVNHTKLLAGYSTANLKTSFLVTGGRNIQDSYIFKEAPIYKAYSFLKSYGEGEEPFIFYQDFEVLIRGHEFVKSVLAQMIALWMRDPDNQSFRSTNINVPKTVNYTETENLMKMPSKEPLIRHLLSLPYFDGYQLEKFYVQMIDSAQKEILITTPYFRPSVAIAGAFDRAAARGVKIQVITRIHLAGDGVPKIAEDVNKQGINRLLRNVDIYEWTDDHSILHAKLFVIDKKMGFVSSVNLNRRSFLHDVESGVLILHEKTAMDLRAQVLRFIKQGRRITQEERISWINGTLIDWADSYF